VQGLSSVHFLPSSSAGGKRGEKERWRESSKCHVLRVSKCVCGTCRSSLPPSLPPCLPHSSPQRRRLFFPPLLYPSLPITRLTAVCNHRWGHPSPDTGGLLGCVESKHEDGEILKEVLMEEVREGEREIEREEWSVSGKSGSSLR